MSLPYPQSSATANEASSLAGCSLLVVDDNEILRERMARAMSSRGLRVRTAANYEQAIDLARAQAPDLAVVDLRMPGPSGLELLRDLLQLRPDMKVVVLTGFGSIATAVEAMRLGATNYLPKPADADEVLAAFTAVHREGAATAQLPDDYQAPSLARAEWEHIQRVLADCGNNISEAARRLGIHRRSLQRKLHKLAPD